MAVEARRKKEGGDILRGFPMDLVIVGKIQIPGNTEAGFGAMTPEGDVFSFAVADAYENGYDLSESEVRGLLSEVERRAEDAGAGSP